MRSLPYIVIGRVTGVGRAAGKRLGPGFGEELHRLAVPGDGCEDGSGQLETIRPLAMWAIPVLGVGSVAGRVVQRDRLSTLGAIDG
jgi:hypothetical protein